MKAFILKHKVAMMLCGILLLAFALRFYKLGEIPLGLNNDETAIGYNAYSIGQNGRDEYGKFMPLYFRSFDDYKLPVYVYMTTITEKIFGVNEFAVRFSSMFFGVVTVLSLFFLIKALSKRSDLALVASFFWAVNPWNIFFSRIGFEVNVATGLAVLGVLFFVKAMQSEKTIFLKLLLSLFFFALSLYSYNVARLVSPLIFCGLVFIYRKKILSLPRLNVAFLVGIFAIMLLPFLITLLSNSGLANQQGSVFITGVNTKGQLLEFRSYFYNLPNFFDKVFINKYLLILFLYLKNVFGFFSFDFFFINGANHPINGVMNFGMFYFIELPFIITGLYVGIKRKEKFLWIFYAWLLIVILLNGLTVEVPHATRSYMIIVPMIIFSAYGFLYILEYLRLQQKGISLPIIVVILCIFLYSFVYFMGDYFIRFPIKFAKTWNAENKSLVTYITQNEDKYRQIVFDKKANFIYTSLLFYMKYSPLEYQRSARYQKDGNLNILATVGKFKFKDIDWASQETVNESTLFIAPSNIINNKYPLLKNFYLPTRPVVNTVNGEIVAYPYQETVYQILESR